MSKWELVRRPEIEPYSSGSADPSQDWRRFVLDQVGYDEVARDRIERKAMRGLAFRRFLSGLLGGLALFALALVVVFAALSWREGRFDRYLPEASEPVEVVPPQRTRVGPPDLTESSDTHVILLDPIHPAARASSSPAEADDGDAPPADAAPADGAD